MLAFDINRIIETIQQHYTLIIDPKTPLKSNHFYCLINTPSHEETIVDSTFYNATVKIKQQLVLQCYATYPNNLTTTQHFKEHLLNILQTNAPDNGFKNLTIQNQKPKADELFYSFTITADYTHYTQRLHDL